MTTKKKTLKKKMPTFTQEQKDEMRSAMKRAGELFQLIEEIRAEDEQRRTHVG